MRPQEFKGGYMSLYEIIRGHMRSNTYDLRPIALIACGVQPNLRHNSI